MAFAVDEAIMGWVLELVLEAVKAHMESASGDYFLKRRIKRQIEDAVAQVVEPLLPFLRNEGLSEAQQRLLMETCVREMRTLVEEPAKLFQASLDGHKLFERLYAGRRFPEEIRQERLEGTYELVGPRIGSLLCELPRVVEAWKYEKWREEFRRLDEVARELRAVFEKVDEQGKATAREADELLRRMRRTLAQRVRMELDLTGLRADRPIVGKLDPMFVHPRLSWTHRAPGSEGPTVAWLEHEAESAAHFLRSYRRAVLTGPPGAGKSTWTKWLQSWALGEGWTGVAIRIELRKLGKGEPVSYIQLLRDEAGPHLGDELDAARIRRWVERGQVAFLLDGFDELPLLHRDEALQWMLDLAEAAAACPILLTSRPLTTEHLRGLPQVWEHWDVHEFDGKRIVRYIEAWYQHAPLLVDADRSVDAPGLASAWQGDPTLAPLTGNPLLLSTLLVVHHLDGKLPSGRAKLYQKYVDGLLGVWDDRREVDAAAVKLSAEQKRRILRRVALHMHLAGHDQIEEDDAKGVVEKSLRDLRIIADRAAVLNTLRERSGLLIGPGTYNFAHKSIGEFLVAEAIAEGNERDVSGERVDRMMLYGHRHEDRWNTVLFFWAGLASAGEVETFVRMCMGQEDWGELLLTISIVHDQGERLSVGMRRELIERMVAVSRVKAADELCSQNAWYGWEIGNPQWKLQLPLLPLRALNRLDVIDVIEEWHGQGHWSWELVRESEGYWGYLCWLVCATSPMSIQEWRQAMQEAPPPRVYRASVSPGGASKSEARWLVPLHFALAHHLREQVGPKPRDLITAFREVLPALETFVSAVLILGFLRTAQEMLTLLEQENERAIVLWSHHVRGHFDLLAEFLTSQVDETWLIGSACLRESRESVDVLQKCLDVLAAPLADGTRLPTPAVETVTRTLEQLITRRATLLAERGLPEPTQAPS